jgi:steroid delta-isomerase-like uncharacterized protein
MMQPLDVAQRYFDAWNQRDPAAIVVTFAEGGTYRDPIVPQGLSGQALATHTAALFAAFPDLSFEIVSAAQVDETTAAAQWVMRGTNSGPLRGTPPTGKTVALPGADFITVADEKICSVQGYFDQKSYLEQLGLQVIVQPYAVGPITFCSGGISLHAAKQAKPGAFSLTYIQVRSDEEVQQVQGYGRRIAADLAQMPGFLSLTTAWFGKRGYTITAWEGAESPKRLLRGGAHREAMQTFFGSDFAEIGTTGVWIPHHINALWVRCAGCGQLSDYEQRAGICECGQPLPGATYW